MASTLSTDSRYLYIYILNCYKNLSLYRVSFTLKYKVYLLSTSCIISLLLYLLIYWIPTYWWNSVGDHLYMMQQFLHSPFKQKETEGPKSYINANRFRSAAMRRFRKQLESLTNQVSHPSAKNSPQKLKKNHVNFYQLRVLQQVIQYEKSIIATQVIKQAIWQ